MSYARKFPRYQPESRKTQQVKLIKHFMGKAITGILSNPNIVNAPGLLNNGEIQEETINKIIQVSKKVAEEASELLTDISREEAAKQRRL